MTAPTLIISKTNTLQADRDIKLPPLLAEKYRLRKGETLKVFDVDGVMVLVPEKLLRNAKARRLLNEWIWDRMEREAEEEIKTGRLYGPFETAEKLLKALKK